MSDDFPARLFPTSFTLLYCPYEDCSNEVPFMDPLCLIRHAEESHGLHIPDPSAVVPLLDRYLKERIKLGKDSLEDEKEQKLRLELQKSRLTDILTMQEQERNAGYKQGRHCLFCNIHLLNYQELFSHMFSQHAFNIGHLDNLVMVGEFLDTLQTKLDKKVCIYCEGVFPCKTTLKKHLKNKGHYRIHPNNHIYDKYYIVNYLLPGKLYEQSKERTELDLVMDGEEDGNNAEAEWEGLTEAVDQKTMCLLCSITCDDPDACLDHMKQDHGFDWIVEKKKANLDDYDAIRVINYMRLKLSEISCVYCDAVAIFDEEKSLHEHLCESHHPLTIPPRKFWNDPQFLFPIFEDDPFLCHLQTISSSSS